MPASCGGAPGERAAEELPTCSPEGRFVLPPVQNLPAMEGADGWRYLWLRETPELTQVLAEEEAGPAPLTALPGLPVPRRPSLALHGPFHDFVA